MIVISFLLTIIIVIVLALTKLLPHIYSLIKTIRGLNHLERIDGEILDYTLRFIIPIIFILNLIFLYILKSKSRFLQ